MESLPAGEVDGAGPEADAGHGLVGPAEVAPDDVEVDEGEANACGEEGQGQQDAVFDGRWSSWKRSARSMRAERKAVSPVEMGSTTTPRMESRPPTGPSSSTEIFLTTTAGVPAAASASGEL